MVETFYEQAKKYELIGEWEKAIEIFEAIIEFSKPIGFIIPQKIALSQIEKIKQKDT